MNKYFHNASTDLQKNYGLDAVLDVILCRVERTILYGEITDYRNLKLHVISGDLTLFGFDDNPSIMFAEIIDAFDMNNKYGEIAGKQEYFDSIVNKIIKFDNECNETFPIIANGKRMWIRLHIVPNKKNKKLSTFFITDVTKYIIHEEELFEKTHKDPVTNLFNNYTLNYHYGERYQDENFHVLFLDLDNFKVINDTEGHNVGNEYLKAFAKMLISFDDNKSLFYRNGGDEFIGLYFAPEERIKEVADKILKATREIKIPGSKHTLSTSIGIIQATIREDVIRKADQVLYKAKNNGKNQYIYEIEK